MRNTRPATIQRHIHKIRDTKGPTPSPERVILVEVPSLDLQSSVRSCVRSHPLTVDLQMSCLRTNVPGVER